MNIFVDIAQVWVNSDCELKQLVIHIIANIYCLIFTITLYTVWCEQSDEFPTQ